MTAAGTTGARYICCDEGRRKALLASTDGLSGIDYVEVVAGPTTADPTKIIITLVKPLPSKSIKLTNVQLTGGTRYPPPPLLPEIVETLVNNEASQMVRQITLTVPGGSQMDFSRYRLALVNDVGSTEPPAFIDVRLSAVDINFKIACAAEADCAPECAAPAAAEAEADFDYRSRDWPQLRQLMLDRIAALVPGFAGDDPLDLTVTLIEALAAEADRLSYRLDWIGTEAFLSTARSRTSVARHARLVNYRPGEGASARLFVALDFKSGNGQSDGLTLPEGTPFMLRTAGLPAVVPAAAWSQLIAQDPLVFESRAPCRMWQWQSAIAFHTWSDDDCRLPAGATAATLVDGSGVNADAMLKPGDLLLLEETVSPHTGIAADADPAHRHVVRLTRVSPTEDKLAPLKKLIEVEWEQADALPFDLVISARPKGGDSAATSFICAAAAGNIVLADHGLSLPPIAALKMPPATVEALRPQLDPPVPVADHPWRPVVDRADLARTLPPSADVGPASRLLATDPAEALPMLTILDEFSQWNARHDLLKSGPFSRDFVVETGMDDRVRLRFGDGVHGLAPAPGSSFAMAGRFGSGRTGNIGPGSLGHVVVADDLAGALIQVRNPLAAQGGADPEPIAAVRIAAPQAFRRQDRAVTPEDYAEVARRHPEVIAAIASPRWTGAFQTMLVHVDRRGGHSADKVFLADVAKHIEHYRLMGLDVAVRPAVMVPLDIGLFVCALPGSLRPKVAADVRDALRPRRQDGTPGFFDPDRFSFGSTLWLSELVAAVMAVPGVQSLEVTAFQRFGRASTGELTNGIIRAHGAEVLQMNDDPSFPEQGRLRIVMGGGR
jgi:hypothetical protein